VSNIEQFLPTDCSIIMNNTKVIKARLFGHKESGAKIEVMYIREFSNYAHEVLIRGKVSIGTKVVLAQNLYANVIALNDDGSRIVEFVSDSKKLNFSDMSSFFELLGHVPLPPYIDRDDTLSDNLTYQSTFACVDGSVAAPTASLHFDDELLCSIQKSHKTAFVTLHIGLGTFKNVEARDIREHQIHTERYAISDDAKTIIDSNCKILAIGTTACRSVEHYCKSGKTTGECDIFIHYANPPTRVNHLMTNFHLPKSTLIMLVASMIGVHKTKQIYQIAIESGYRFYSYGDAMLIL
jgi:S-adenosylmethionine:tRNA ribosyltransferase-isomerase